MRQTIVRENLDPILLKEGDSVQFTVRDGDDNILFSELSDPAEEEQTLNKVEAFTFTEEFNMKFGYGLLVGRE